jgi:hypothetical protein
MERLLTHAITVEVIPEIICEPNSPAALREGKGSLGFSLAPKISGRLGARGKGLPILIAAVSGALFRLGLIIWPSS